MALTKTDRDFIQLNIQGVNARITDMHDHFEDKLNSIEKQTIKTNGRVNILEINDHERSLFCSAVQARKIGINEQQGIDNARKKDDRMKWVQIITLIIMATGISLTAFGMIKNSKKIGTFIEYERIKEQVDANTKIILRGGYVIDSIAPEYWTENDTIKK